MSRITEAIDLAARGAASEEYEGTIKLCTKALNEYPDNPPMLAIMGDALIKVERYYEASLVLERLISLDTGIPYVLGALAKAYAEMAPYHLPYYERCQEIAHRSIEEDPEDVSGHMTLAYAALHLSDYDKAFEWSKKGLEVEPESRGNKYNSATPMLFNHMWEEGWTAYEQSLRARYRKFVPEYKIPLWEGQPGTVIVTGEQGLGDEIMLSSLIPDLQKTNEVIIDTVPPLEELFRQSFGCQVYGTRHQDDADWKDKPPADYWCPMGNLASHYRSKHEDFPGKPYIKPDPQRRLQWRSLLDSLGDRPKIGIAWTGGVVLTNEKARSLTLKQIAPILEYDADWISLQYKNLKGIPDYIHHWDRSALGTDFSETAALIAELDLVISVTTTAVHCAGAVGTKTWCLVPENPSWRYGAKGDRMVWYDSVELLRQEGGEWPIQQVCERLSQMGIKKCRDNSVKRKHTIQPGCDTPNWLPPLSHNAGLVPCLITGLGQAA